MCSRVEHPPASRTAAAGACFSLPSVTSSLGGMRSLATACHRASMPYLTLAICQVYDDRSGSLLTKLSKRPQRGGCLVGVARVDRLLVGGPGASHIPLLREQLS